MNLRSATVRTFSAIAFLMIPHSGFAEQKTQNTEEFCNRWNNPSPAPTPQYFSYWGMIFGWSRFISKKQNHCTAIEVKNCQENAKICNDTFYYKHLNGVNMTISESWINNKELIRSLLERKICAYKPTNIERICLNFDNLEEALEIKQDSGEWEIKTLLNAGQYDKNLNLKGMSGKDCNLAKNTKDECKYVKAEIAGYNHIIEEASNNNPAKIDRQVESKIENTDWKALPSTKLSFFQKNEEKIAWKECISNNPSDWIMQCDQKLQQKVYDEFNNAYKFGGILHVNSLINSCYKKIQNIEDFKYCYIFDRVASVIDSKYSTLLGSKQNYFNNLNLVDERASEIFSKLSNQSIQKEIHVSNWSRSADQIIRRFSNTQMPKKIVDAIEKKYTDDTFSAIMNTLSRIRSIRRINAGGPGKIAFQLDSTGKLINSTIQESSGSSISDDLALDLIKKTKFSGRPVWISGNLIFSYDFSGPIAKTRHLKSQITRTNRKTY